MPRQEPRRARPGTDPGLAVLAPWLRLRVARLRASTRARNFPVQVEVVPVPPPAVDRPERPACPPQPASPAASPPAWQDDGGPLDHGLRVDLLCGLWGPAGTAAVVVVRPDRHEVPTTRDLAWLASARAAAGVVGDDLCAVVMVSRWGWHDLLSGEHREWLRLRIR